VTVSRNQIRFAVNMSEFTTNGGRTETTAINGPTNVRFIKVTLPQHSINVIFAGVFLNSNQVALTRSAIAGLSVNGLGGDTGMNTICNWVPLCVVQDEDGAPLDRVVLTPSAAAPGGKAMVGFRPAITSA
jgi:hypothetical protein